MLILALNTVGPACEVAVITTGQPAREHHEVMQRGQDARLPCLVARSCADANVHIGDIDRFAVITGPGNFTGIRIGVAFARGLALATGAPCLGISSLEAALPNESSGSSIVVLPAKKRPPDNTFWIQTFNDDVATGMVTEWPAAALTDYLQTQKQTVYGNIGCLDGFCPGVAVFPTKPTAYAAGRRATCLDPKQHPPCPLYARVPDAVLPTRKMTE